MFISVYIETHQNDLNITWESFSINLTLRHLHDCSVLPMIQVQLHIQKQTKNKVGQLVIRIIY